jgi:hypothetical protein
MTAAAFDNTIAVDMAVGGSTNSTLHLPAIATRRAYRSAGSALARSRAHTPAPGATQAGWHALCPRPVRCRRGLGGDAELLAHGHLDAACPPLPGARLARISLAARSPIPRSSIPVGAAPPRGGPGHPCGTPGPRRGQWSRAAPWPRR